MFNILIVDDESLARETIKLLLQDQDDVDNIYEAADGNKGLELAEIHRPQLAFLDIEMPGLSGIELAKRLPNDCVVVFATAYNEYAVTAFELNAIDYLLKPFEDERFYASLERAKMRFTEEKQQDYSKISEAIQKILNGANKTYRERLVIRDPGRIRLVDVEHIDYITGAGNYAEIHLQDGKQVLHRETLSALEEQLDPGTFVRIHRSSIVRRSCISELRPNDKGDYSVILHNGEILTLSRRNRAKLDELTH